MTITVERPTFGHVYRFYQIANGHRTLLGSNKTGKWTISHQQAKPGHAFVVTATDPAGKTSDASTVLKT